MVLRPGKTPGGVEVRAHLRRLVRHVRKSWPDTRITFRGDGHYARTEVMQWCENNSVAYVFGLPGSKSLARAVDDKAHESRAERALRQGPAYAALPKSGARPSPGSRRGASSRASRPHRSASTFVSSGRPGLDRLEHGCPEYRAEGD